MKHQETKIANDRFASQNQESHVWRRGIKMPATHCRFKATAVFQNLATAEASHMINMSNLTNQFAPITSAFHLPVARFWKTAVASQLGL